MRFQYRADEQWRGVKRHQKTLLLTNNLALPAINVMPEGLDVAPSRAARDAGGLSLPRIHAPRCYHLPVPTPYSYAARHLTLRHLYLHCATPRRTRQQRKEEGALLCFLPSALTSCLFSFFYRLSTCALRASCLLGAPPYALCSSARDIPLSPAAGVTAEYSVKTARAGPSSQSLNIPLVRIVGRAAACTFYLPLLRCIDARTLCALRKRWHVCVLRQERHLLART